MIINFIEYLDEIHEYVVSSLLENENRRNMWGFDTPELWNIQRSNVGTLSLNFFWVLIGVGVS